MSRRQSELNKRAAELVAQFDAFARRFAIRRKTVCHGKPSLTRQEFRVIGAVGEKRAWMAGELARHLALGMSSLTSVLDRLVAKRLVTRERSDEDRRVVWIRLTAQGRRRYGRFRRMRFRIARHMLSALNRQEQKTFIGLMRQIGQGVQGR